MCGIAGVFDYRAAIGSVERASEVVRGMTASLRHRGPDGEGLWADPLGRCVLGHRRLKVIDPTDAGRQPMTSSDGRWVISLNGEIYNFEELRPRLEEAGLAIRGRTDTETLLGGLALWGRDALRRLDGMFAFAAFDTVTGELLMARDPFGEKPLYYTELEGGGIAFASEVQALEQLPQFDGEVSVDALAELMMFQYVGAPRSIYRSVRKLPAGHFLSAATDRPPSVTRYFEFRQEGEESNSRTIADLADELEEILVRSLRRRLIADVPLGAFLSGGVDSSTVCALVRHRLGRSLKTFSIGFAQTTETEHSAARSFAEQMGHRHTDRILAPGSVELLATIGRELDEPNADWSCFPVFLLSALAREQVTVVLSGDGGDEMFAGYDWYFAPLEREREATSADPPWRADEAYMAGLLMTGEPIIARLFGIVPPLLPARLEQIRARINEGSSSLVFRLRRNEAENYLPGAVLAKVDRMSMRHSLEVRTPYLNLDVARFAARLPSRLLYGRGMGKLLLREVAYRYLPRQWVDRPKMGFGLPGGDWGGREVRRIAENLLLSDESRLSGCLGRDVLHRYLKQEPDVHRHWTLAMLESWCRNHPAKLPLLSHEPFPDLLN